MYLTISVATDCYMVCVCELCHGTVLLVYMYLVFIYNLFLYLYLFCTYLCCYCNKLYILACVNNVTELFVDVFVEQVLAPLIVTLSNGL